MKSSLMESCLFWTKNNFVIFKRWSGWSKYYRCWIIPAGKTCRSLNLTKRFPFTHYNIPWLYLILTVMIPYMKYYTSIPNQLPFVEKNFPYWKMSLQNLGQECWDGLCVGESLMRKKSGLNFLDANAYNTDPALLRGREKESSYLSPNLSFQAALASQMVTGRSKQHGKTNWDWDMRSLSLVSAVMLDVFGRRVKKVK